MTETKRLPRGLGYGPGGRVMTRIEYMAWLEREIEQSLTPEEREKNFTVWRQQPNGELIVKGDMS